MTGLGQRCASPFFLRVLIGEGPWFETVVDVVAIDDDATLSTTRFAAVRFESTVAFRTGCLGERTPGLFVEATVVDVSRMHVISREATVSLTAPHPSGGQKIRADGVSSQLGLGGYSSHR